MSRGNESSDRLVTDLKPPPARTPPDQRHIEDMQDAWEETSDLLREAGFTGINMLGDLQFVICKRDGAWLQLPVDPLPPDEYFAFTTSWVDRHLVAVHEQVPLWFETDEMEDCHRNWLRTKGPHVVQVPKDIPEHPGFRDVWILCPGKHLG